MDFLPKVCYTTRYEGTAASVGVAQKRHPVVHMALIVRFVVVVLVGTDKGLVSCLVENGILAGGRTMPLAGVARDKVAAPDDRAQ